MCIHKFYKISDVGNERPPVYRPPAERTPLIPPPMKNPLHRGASDPFFPTPDQLFCVLSTYSLVTGRDTDLALSRKVNEACRRRLNRTVHSSDRLLPKVRNPSLGAFKYEYSWPSGCFFVVVRPPVFWPWEGSNYLSRS